MQLFRLFTGTEEQGQALHGHDEEDGTTDEGDGVLLGLLVAVLPLVEHADGIGGGQHGGDDVDEGLDIGQIGCNVTGHALKGTGSGTHVAALGEHSPGNGGQEGHGEGTGVTHSLLSLAEQAVTGLGGLSDDIIENLFHVV